MTPSDPGESPPARLGGFVPIEGYAVLSDGQSAALVSLDGRIDWWATPTVDSPPVCGALLDPYEGGSFSLAPDGRFTVRRQYVTGTNVLETLYTTDTGSVRVTECLCLGVAGPLPWTELARQIDGLSGEVSLRWTFSPGRRFNSVKPWISESHGSPIVHVGDQAMSVIVDGAEAIEVSPHTVGGFLRCAEGERRLVAVLSTDDEPVVRADTSAVYRRIDGTVETWQRWHGGINAALPVPAVYEQAVRRSALALKSVQYLPSGGIAAAVTTSLPESIGGERNWDYRYSWVRDSSFAVDALITLGLHEEAHAAVSWLLGAVRRTAPEIHAFYSLSGEVADELAEVAITGYRDSRPVRSGNSASEQLQLGNFGDLFDTVWRYVEAGNVLDPTTAHLLCDLANRCCDRWLQRDSGIWELSDQQHYTISKMACWTALDRAGRLVEREQLPSQFASRWAAEASDIRAWVEELCWAPERGAYTFYAGTEELDAAVLLAGRTGFDRGNRLSSTIDAVLGELTRGPMVYRYSGMQDEEGAFIACSFWLVEAMAHVGRLDEADDLMGHALHLCNDVGLLSEQVAPSDGSLLGNLPQGLSHLALINAAHSLNRDSD